MWPIKPVISIVCINYNISRTVKQMFITAFSMNMVKKILCCYVVVFLRLQTSDLSSIPCGSCPCVMYIKFRVKRESPSHRNCIIWRDLALRLENSFLNRMFLWITSCCTDISVSPSMVFRLHSCLCFFIQWKSLRRFTGSRGLHNCAGVGVVRIFVYLRCYSFPDSYVMQNTYYVPNVMSVTTVQSKYSTSKHHIF